MDPSVFTISASSIHFANIILGNPDLLHLQVDYATFDTVHLPNAPAVIAGIGASVASLVVFPFLLAALGSFAISVIDARPKIIRRLPPYTFGIVKLTIWDCMHISNAQDDDCIFIDTAPFQKIFAKLGFSSR